MRYGSEGINGRHEWADDDQLRCLADTFDKLEDRAVKRVFWMTTGGLVGMGILACVGGLVLTSLLFHQGPDWVREGGFWARTAAACGLVTCLNSAFFGALLGFCRFNWKSPVMALLKLSLTSGAETGNEGSRLRQEFKSAVGPLMCGILAAIVWEIVLVLIGRGFVASTFGVVAAFLGAAMLILTFVFLGVLFFLVVAGRVTKRRLRATNER